MSNNRRRNRFAIPMKVELIGQDINKKIFYETCKCKDASIFGVSIIMKTLVSRRTIVYLVMPMPSNLRLHDIEKTTYEAYGVVRHIEPINGGFYQVGVSILGKISPRGYENYEKILLEKLSGVKQSTIDYEGDPVALPVRAVTAQGLKNK